MNLKASEDVGIDGVEQAMQLFGAVSAVRLAINLAVFDPSCEHESGIGSNVTMSAARSG